MDIIFQSGEFYGQDGSFWTSIISIIGAILGAVVSGLIAIWIFKKGLAEQIRKEYESKIEKEEELEEYIFHLIGFTNLTIDQQIVEIAQTSQALKDYGRRDLGINTVSALSTEEINSIETKELYRIFMSAREGNANEKAADFLNLKSCFRYIDQQKVSYIEFNKSLYDRLEEYRTLWNYHLKRLLDLYNQFVQHSAKSSVTPRLDPFLDFYKSVMVTTQRKLIANGQANNIEIMHCEMILPLMNFIKENRNVLDQRIVLISSSVMGCDQAFQETKELRYQKRDVVLKYGRNLLGVKRLMNECINNTKKRKKHMTFIRGA